MPLPNILEFIGTNVTQAGFKVAQQKLLDYLGVEVSTKTELNSAISSVNSAITPKADKVYVDTALSSFQNGALKTYPTLAAANADITNIALNTKVSVLSATEGGDYYKATAGATSLTKSPYDSLEQAKADATIKASTAQNTAVAHTDKRVDDLGIKQSVNEDIAFAVVGFEGRRTWIEIDPTGSMTPYAVSQVLAKLQASIISLAQAQIADIGLKHINTPDLSFSIIDANNRRLWLEADEKGLPSSYALQCIIQGLNNSGIGTTPTEYKSTYNDTTIKIASGPDIVCFGDSMTAGSGGGGTTYPSTLKTLMQNAGSTANVYNMGVGGETSTTICARQGGNPFILSVTDGIIPADTTPVKVALRQINGNTVTPLLQGATTWDGKLGDIAGVLNLVEPNGSQATWQSNNYYTFARKTAGAQITADRNFPFYLDVAAPRLGDIHIIWVGQNNPDPDRNIADAKAMVRNMRALDKRYIIISRPAGTTAQNEDDAKWFAEFGRHFIPIRQYMVEFGLSDAGITPTAQDLTDISNGTVPTSLRSDAVHWTAAGYQILANVVFKKLKELEYI